MVMPMLPLACKGTELALTGRFFKPDINALAASLGGDGRLAGPLPWREKIGDIRVHDYTQPMDGGWGSELL